jgi:iron-sulfur cluster repair protein YtfE (RIC family)
MHICLFNQTKSVFGGLISVNSTEVFSGDSSLCDILQASPLALVILQQAGLHDEHIAQCVRLSEATAKAGIALHPLLKILNAQISRTGFENKDYQGLTLDALLQMLQQQHRELLEKRLPRLALLTTRLEKEFSSHSSVFEEIRRLLQLLKADLAQHILEEEEAVFGYVHQLQAALRHNEREKLAVLIDQPSPLHHLLRCDEDEPLFEAIKQQCEQLSPTNFMHRHLKAEIERLAEAIQAHENAEFEELLSTIVKLENEAIACLKKG